MIWLFAGTVAAGVHLLARVEGVPPARPPTLAEWACANGHGCDELSTENRQREGASWTLLK